MSLEIKPMGGLRHDNGRALDPSTTLVTAIGGMDLDLRGAELPSGGAGVTKVSLIGGVRVVVPVGVRVEVSGFTLLGGRDVERDGDRVTAVVFEDALAGVEAGRAGHFGCVVGVDRVGHADALRRHGATIVVEDLAELLEES